nr:response regulator [Candidatus Goldiibacteriota bacterium]
MAKFSFHSESNIKLLLVEDEKSLAKYLQISLQDEAGNIFNVKNASYLSEAMAFAGQENFDVVLLDLNLPDSNGMDTLIKFRERFPDIAVVILTGMEDKEFSLRAVKEGAQDYLIKGETEAGVLVRSIFYAIERNRFIIDRRKGRLELEESYEKLKTISDGIIFAMEKIVETRDPYTAGHQRRVAQLAKAI